MTRTHSKWNAKKAFGVLAILLLLVALDRGSKVFMESFLADKGTITLIPQVLGLYLLEGGNTGAAFGSFSGNTFVLIVVTGLVLAALLYTLLFRKFSSGWVACAAILVTAGGFGNLYDRVVYGSVTDFFRFLFIEFPIFNVADCYITVGAAVLVCFVLFSKHRNDPIFAGNVRAKEAKEPNTGETVGASAEHDRDPQSAADGKASSDCGREGSDEGGEARHD